MPTGWTRCAACVCLAAGLLAGCHTGEHKLHYLGKPDLAHYIGHATDIDYPHVHSPTPDEVRFTGRPHVLGELDEAEIWDIELIEALHLALANNPIIRRSFGVGTEGGGGFLALGNPLYTNPEFVASVYEPAIQETGVLFGRRGVEGALAAFDTQLNMSMGWSKDERILNIPFGIEPGRTLVDDRAAFRSSLSKQFAQGGTFTVSSNWDYLSDNFEGRLFDSIYTGNVRAAYRQPLLAGAGAEYTHIAGPIGLGFFGITGVNQGVVIARINNDITVAEFQANVRNMIKDVEDLYWELYLRYQQYHASVRARDSSLRTWRDARARLDIGGFRNFQPADEAQARDQYFERRAVVESNLADLYWVELQLRRMLGLPVNEGRILRPADEPTTAEFQPDWYAALAEGLTERVELRRQKWLVKSLELQLRAARNLTRPRLDFVSGYQVNAFGDNLFGRQDDDGITRQGLRSAMETLTQGDQTGWDLGFEMSMPIGFRSAHTQVRNHELRLAKAKQVLATQEMEVAYELANAFQNLARHFATAQSNINRRQAALRRVELFEAEVEQGTRTPDDLLRAQVSLAEAEVAYFTSVVGYNQAITNLHFRKESLLQFNNVYLSEGGWDPEAYRQALERARARSHAIPGKWRYSDPEEFVLDGPIREVQFYPPDEPSGVTLPPPPIDEPLDQELPPPAEPELPLPRRLELDPPAAEPRLPAPTGADSADESAFRLGLGGALPASASLVQPPAVSDRAAFEPSHKPADRSVSLEFLGTRAW